MSATKLVNLNLDYELNKVEKEDLKEMTGVTRNLISQAFQINYQQGMDSKVAKSWRQIRKAVDKAIEDDKCGFVIFSMSDFETVYDEVLKCRYNPMMARFAPYLYDELDTVKQRSDEDEEKEQKSMEVIKGVGDKLVEESLKPEGGSPSVTDITEVAAKK